MSAQPIYCNLCDAEIGAMMVSNLTNGDTLAVGPNCMHAWLTSMLAALTPEPEMGAPAPPPGEGPTGEGETAAAKPRRPRPAPKRPTVVPDRSDDISEIVAEADATAD